MLCKYCKVELPDEAEFCWKCGKPQSGSRVQETKWESCEIVCAQVHKSEHESDEWEFYAKAEGSKGQYRASESFITNVDPDSKFDELSQEKKRYLWHVFDSLVRALVKDRWEPLDIPGIHWYSYRFRRRSD